MGHPYMTWQRLLVKRVINAVHGHLLAVRVESGTPIALQRLTGKHGFVLCHVQDGQDALAGAPPEATGVYVGCVWQEYALALERLRVAPSVAVLTGSGLNFMVGRVSYTFGFQGAPVHH